MPIGTDGIPCAICGKELKKRDFYKSIEPRAGFIAEEEVRNVPLTYKNGNTKLKPSISVTKQLTQSVNMNMNSKM
jgi:hypothetical protein